MKALNPSKKNKYIEKLLKGNTPVELTASELEVHEAIEILDGFCVYIDANGRDWDFGGQVYWNETKTVAVIVWDN